MSGPVLTHPWTPSPSLTTPCMLAALLEGEGGAQSGESPSRETDSACGGAGVHAGRVASQPACGQLDWGPLNEHLQREGRSITHTQPGLVDFRTCGAGIADDPHPARVGRALQRGKASGRPHHCWHSGLFSNSVFLGPMREKVEILDRMRSRGVL